MGVDVVVEEVAGGFLVEQGGAEAGVGGSLDEGVEVNLLGASYGVDLYPPALKLPAIGRLGF